MSEPRPIEQIAALLCDARKHVGDELLACDFCFCEVANMFNAPERRENAVDVLPLSARPECVKAATLAWLSPPDELFGLDRVGARMLYALRAAEHAAREGGELTK